MPPRKRPRAVAPTRNQKTHNNLADFLSKASEALAASAKDTLAETLIRQNEEFIKLKREKMKKEQEMQRSHIEVEQLRLEQKRLEFEMLKMRNGNKDE